MNDGAQRLSVEQLKAWEDLSYGLFVHFGMSTFDASELSKGDKPSSYYCPDELDVDQWISVARDAGMKYAILTTKHVSGHCLWPSRFTDYHVGTSGNTTDVVAAFVAACRKYGIMPGFYYCSWDNHHLFGSLTPSMTKGSDAYTTEAYQQFQSRQLEELLTQYGKIGEVWIDIPRVLPRGYRHKLYQQIADMQPEAVIMMNNGFGDGSELSIEHTWPTDLVSIERDLPKSHHGYQPWRDIEGQAYYIPGEICETLGREWFYVEGDHPRSDAELLGMFLLARSRHVNLLLDVGPDKRGLLPQKAIDSLMRLRMNAARLQDLL